MRLTRLTRRTSGFDVFLPRGAAPGTNVIALETSYSMPEMVRMSGQNRERAVKLLQQQYARELVR